MKTYLVTGGAGFIGSNFIKYIMNKYNDINIINVDALTYAGDLKNLKDISSNANYTFIHANICDKVKIAKIFDSHEVNFVVNFAAESHVDRSIEGPDIFMETNVKGTLNLLNIAKDFWTTSGGLYKAGNKFIQISTDEVYGSLGSTGYFTENTPLDPHSPYSASKASADMFVKSYFDTYGFPMNITRCSNNYGPNQFPEKLIPLMINNALSKIPLPIYGDGMNIRDWLYVTDHCEAIDKVIHNGKVGDVYNIGGHNEKTNIEIVSTIISYLNKNVDNLIDSSLITYIEDRKGHDRRYAIDSTKISEELSWIPTVSFNEGIIKTIDWYIAEGGGS